MLGDASLAEVPFAALSGGIEYTRYVSASALATDAEGAAVIFEASAIATSTGTASALVAPSTFSATISELSTGTALDVGAFQDHAVFVEATANGADYATVAPSVFNAEVQATAAGIDIVLTYAVHIAAISEGALGVDAVTQRLLWEVINDYQPSSWTIIKTQS